MKKKPLNYPETWKIRVGKGKKEKLQSIPTNVMRKELDKILKKFSTSKDCNPCHK